MVQEWVSGRHSLSRHDSLSVLVPIAGPNDAPSAQTCPKLKINPPKFGHSPIIQPLPFSRKIGKKYDSFLTPILSVRYSPNKSKNIKNEEKAKDIVQDTYVKF